jgi:hypothetical protein
MTIHDAWAAGASTASATGDLRMDELTAHQLADELTTLAASMFGLLQAHPGSDPVEPESPAGASTVSPEAPLLQDPASVTSVAIPVEPVVAIAVPEQWAPPEAEAEATEDEPAAPPATLEVPSLAVPSLAVPEVPPAVDLPSGTPRLSLVEPIEVPELEPQDLETPDRESEPEAPAPRQSMALLNEIAFLDD